MQTRSLVFGLSLLLAVGCFSDDGDGNDSESPATGGGAGAAGADGDGGTSSGGTSSGGTGGDTEEHEDPYCPHAWNGFEQLDIFLAETKAIQDDPDMDGATMNAHGEAALDAAELTGQHFGRAQEFAVETEASEAFDAMLLYQELYMVPHAEIAATSSGMDDYTMASFEHVQEDGVDEAAAGGILASGTISAYTLERCGNNRWPE